MPDQVTNGKTKWSILNDEDLNAAWRYLSKRCNASSTSLALILATGIRPAEARAVCWRDWSPSDQLAIHSKKSHRNMPRILALNSIAQDILDTWKKRTQKEKLYRKTRPICTSTLTRRPISTRSIRYAAARLGLHLDIETLKPYDLRHTFAVLVVDALGVGAASDLLGHRSPATTLRYVHARPRDRKAAADLMKGSRP